jgi:hypothetical protein
MKSLICFILSIFALTSCITSSPPPAKKIQGMGHASRIDILTGYTHFKPNDLPRGWSLSGLSQKEAFRGAKHLPVVQQFKTKGRAATHIQNQQKDFILYKRTGASLLVTPYLLWQWHPYEHTGAHSPVRLVIGFKGGKTQIDEDEKPPANDLPDYDRILNIGFDDMALKRNNLYTMGKLKYYTQRGGIEQTNQWFSEAADLSVIYQHAWPKDDLSKAMITFIGFGAVGQNQAGAISFANVQLTR